MHHCSQSTASAAYSDLVRSESLAWHGMALYRLNEQYYIIHSPHTTCRTDINQDMMLGAALYCTSTLMPSPPPIALSPLLSKECAAIFIIGYYPSPFADSHVPVRRQQVMMVSLHRTTIPHIIPYISLKHYCCIVL
jgi:hypothetical protein